MWDLMHEELRGRQIAGQPVRFAILGLGYMGKGLAVQASQVNGLSLSMVMTRDSKRAASDIRRILPGCGVRLCNNEHEVKYALANREVAIVKEHQLVAAEELEVVVDCTGDARLGAVMATQALEAGQHFIASPETDATVGPFLAREARRQRLVFGGAHGDEPALVKEIYDYVSLLGFEVVAAGKFKGFHDVRANPVSVLPWATKHQQNPRMLASFADGSKMALEMALVSNATGLLPDCPGMHCPEGNLGSVASLLSLVSEGGLLSRRGVVEVVRGVEPSGGVFVVATTKSDSISRDMRYLKMGEGPNYLFYRPYHLAAVELPVSIAQAAILGRPSIAAKGAPCAGVFAMTKRAMKAGTMLDGIGGYSYYGLIDHFEEISAGGLLPLGLAEGAVLLRDVREDEGLTMSDVELEPSLLSDMHSAQLASFSGRDQGE